MIKEFFTEWWDIQKEVRAMEKTYYKKHWKGVLLLNVGLIAVPAATTIVVDKVKKHKKTKK